MPPGAFVQTLRTLNQGKLVSQNGLTTFGCSMLLAWA